MLRAGQSQDQSSLLRLDIGIDRAAIAGHGDAQISANLSQMFDVRQSRVVEVR
jgi:hypothetical protein